MQSTAAEAAQTGAQAKAAAAAYQTAYSSMVPPPVITANRTELTTLVSNNFLGQNTGAIANNEADYLSMWIQDALGMDTYQLNSSTGAVRRSARTDAPHRWWPAAPTRRLRRRQPPRPTPATDAVDSGRLVLTPLRTSLACTESTTPRRLVSHLGHICRPRSIPAIAADPTAALLPVQATYYMGMLGSTPARMFMSAAAVAAPVRQRRRWPA